jgi:hypothetical protein
MRIWATLISTSFRRNQDAAVTNPFAHFPWFLLSVANHIFTLAAGCAVTVLIGLFEKYILKRPISVKIEVIVLLAFLFFACFQAWRDEYDRATTEQTELHRLKAPNLIGEITGVTTAPGGEGGRDTLLTVWAEIKNTGAPSIAENISLEAHFPDGRIKPVISLPRTSKSVRLLGDLRDQGILLLTQDFLSTKALAAPIATGGAVEGWAWGVLYGTTPQEARKDAVVVMKFRDVSGRLVETKGRPFGPSIPIEFDPSKLQPKL